MHRRRVLQGIATASFLASGGCLGEQSGAGGEPTDPTTEDRTTQTTDEATIRVVREVGAGGFTPPWRLVVEDDGRLQLTVECTGRTETVTDRLSANQRAALREAVLAVDRDSLAGRYTSRASDQAEETLTLSVDGQETTVTFAGTGSIPDALSRLVTRLDRYRPELERACGDPDTPIEVSRTFSSGYSPAPWKHTVTVTDDGYLESTFDCQTKDEVEREREGLGASEHGRIRGLVEDLELAALKDEYTCTGTCPTDLPSVTMRIRVGDRTKEIYFYQPDEDEVPDRLQTLSELLASYSERFEHDCPPPTSSGG